MNILICFIVIIILSLFISLFSTYIFGKNAWVVILIEIPMVLSSTLKDIIEIYPSGNIKYQLTSYFVNFNNKFYLRYLPLFIFTIIFIIYFKGKFKNLNSINKEDIIGRNDFSKYYFLGRWTEKIIDNEECIYTINLGSEIYAKIKGTETIKINFLNTNPIGNPVEIAYKVNDEKYIRDNISNSPFIIDNLDKDKDYILKIVASGNKDDDEVWNKEQGIAFTGIDIDADGIIEPFIQNKKIGLFYGDSITAGCWVLDRNIPSQGYAAEANYVAKCCEALGCLNVRVAFSASGVTKGGTGGVPKFIDFIDNMDSMTKEKSQFPDFIVINMGTNDNEASMEEFQDELLKCVKRIQDKYKGVTIFLMLPFINVRKEEIKKVVSMTENTVFIDTTGWNVQCIDCNHPNLKGSKVAGEKLAGELLKYYGIEFFK